MPVVRGQSCGILLPEVQKAPHRECKQLHSIEAVLLEELKSNSLLLRCCMVLLSLKSVKKNFKQKWSSKTLDSVASRAKLDIKLAQVTDFVVALCPKAVVIGAIMLFLWSCS